MSRTMTDAERWERFESHVIVQPDGCWLWTAATDRCGYGKVRWPVQDRIVMRPAHRISYERRYGPVAHGFVLDHYACDNPQCVNPDHVRPVTVRENTLRGNSITAEQAARTHCPQGHAYVGYNVKRDKLGKRTCRVCMRARVKARYYARRVAHPEAP